MKKAISSSRIQTGSFTPHYGLVLLCFYLLSGLSLQGQTRHTYATGHIPVDLFPHVELVVRNNLIKDSVSLEVQWVQGKRTEVILPGLEIASAEQAVLDLAGHLREVGRGEAGFLRLSYEGRGAGAITAKVNCLNPKLSWAYTVPALNSAVEFQNRRLHGLTLVPSPQSHLEVFLTNVSTSSLTAQLEVSGTGGRHQVESVIGAGKTTRINLSGVNAGAVQLLVDHDGRPGDLLGGGLVLDRRTGFSLGIAFQDVAWAQSKSLTAAQVAVDRIPGVLEAADPELISYLVLANTASVEQTLSIELVVGGESYGLGEVVIGPSSTRMISLNDLQDQGYFPSAVSDGYLLADHDGPRGSLIGAVISTSPDQRIVLSTPLKAARGFRYHLSEWRTDDAYNTLLSVVNPEPTEIDVEIGVQGKARSFKSHWKLAPYAQRTLDFRSLMKDEAFVDSQGNQWEGLSRGTFYVNSERQPGSLVVHYQIVNPELGTCEPGTGELAYFEDILLEFEQPDGYGGAIRARVKGMMNNGDIKDITSYAGKYISGTGVAGMEWSFDGTLIFPENSGSLTLTAEATLTACSAGSFDNFSGSFKDLLFSSELLAGPDEYFKKRSPAVYSRCPNTPAQTCGVITGPSSHTYLKDVLVARTSILGFTNCRWTKSRVATGCP